MKEIKDLNAIFGKLNEFAQIWDDLREDLELFQTSKQGINTKLPLLSKYVEADFINEDDKSTNLVDLYEIIAQTIDNVQILI